MPPCTPHLCHPHLTSLLLLYYFTCCGKLIFAITTENQLSARIAAHISATDLESANWLASQAAGEGRLKPCVKSSPPETAQI